MLGMASEICAGTFFCWYMTVIDYEHLILSFFEEKFNDRKTLHPLIDRAGDRPSGG